MWGFTYVTEASQIFRLLQQRVLKGKYWFCRFFKQFVQSGLTPPKSIMNSNESIFDTGISDTTSMPYGRSGSRSSKSSESFAGFRHSQLPLVTWRWTSHQQCNKKHWNASIPKNLQTQTSLSCMDLSDSTIMLKKISSQKRMVFFLTNPRGSDLDISSTTIHPWFLTSHPKPPIPTTWVVEPPWYHAPGSCENPELKRWQTLLVLLWFFVWNLTGNFIEIFMLTKGFTWSSY